MPLGVIEFLHPSSRGLSDALPCHLASGNRGDGFTIERFSFQKLPFSLVLASLLVEASVPETETWLVFTDVFFLMWHT
jgi:hypothetical protein